MLAIWRRVVRKGRTEVLTRKQELGKERKVQDGKSTGLYSNHLLEGHNSRSLAGRITIRGLVLRPDVHSSYLQRELWF